MCTTWPAHLILLYLIVLIIFFKNTNIFSNKVEVLQSIIVDLTYAASIGMKDPMMSTFHLQRINYDFFISFWYNIHYRLKFILLEM
jgi:hypothetical protein